MMKVVGLWCKLFGDEVDNEEVPLYNPYNHNVDLVEIRNLILIGGFDPKKFGCIYITHIIYGALCINIHLFHVVSNLVQQIMEWTLYNQRTPFEKKNSPAPTLSLQRFKRLQIK